MHQNIWPSARLSALLPLTDQQSKPMPGVVKVSEEHPQVRFEQEGTRLMAIEITRGRGSPVIAVLQRTLFALGIVVSSYQARARATRLVERVVIERSDGGSIDGSLSVATKAAILPIALEQPAPPEPEV